MATRESRANMKVSGVALEKFVEPRFLPSRAMKSTLDEMWCTPITADAKLVAEIRSQVQAKCDARLRFCSVQSVFPGFVGTLLQYEEVTQEDIDNAWYDAAIDLLGRPASKDTSKNDCFRDLHRHATRHRISSIWPDDGEPVQQSFMGRQTIRRTSTSKQLEQGRFLPRSTSRYRMLNSSMADTFERIEQAGQTMSNKWPDDWEAAQQEFEGRQDSRHTSTSDYDMVYTSSDDPFESTQRDDQRITYTWLDDQEEVEQAFENRPTIRHTSTSDHDMLCTSMEHLFDPIHCDGQRESNICLDHHGTCHEVFTGGPASQQ